MKIHQIERKSSKKVTRVGRGIAAGKGKTAGRGTKGQKSRTGKKLRIGFEGGQVSYAERLPKNKGFKSFKTKSEVVYTKSLEKLDSKKVIDNYVLAEAKLISSPFVVTKLILSGDDLKSVFTVKVQAASKGAIEVIQKVGGNVEIVARVQQEKKQN
jgi:large subunit ribosomal protein L15